MRKLFVGLISVLAAAACDSTPPPVATTISISPGSLSLDAVGATRIVRASVADQKGRSMPGVALAWSSSSASATVVGAGGDSAVVTATGNGAATISAAAGSATGTLTLQVIQVVASIHKAGGDEQSGTVAGTLARPIRVEARDRLGQPVAGTPVSFAVSSGGGTVASETAATGADGVAQTTWMLGTMAAIPQRVSASVGSLPVQQFTATALAGPASSAFAVAGNHQTAPGGSIVAVAPRVTVRDAFGNPVAGVAVQFAVTTGGGTVSGAGQTTDAVGEAAVGSWALGASPGANTLAAAFPGTAIPAVVFSANSGITATVSIVAGAHQGAMAGTQPPTRPRVLVRDGSGNPMAGIPVVFSVTEGGGTATGTTVATDASGFAEVGGWTLGTVGGPNRLTASASGVIASPVVFRGVGCVGGGGGGYDMTLCFLTPVTASQRAAYTSAAARWGTIITGDLPGLTGTIPAGSCGADSPALTGFGFDDLLIFASVEPIDGPGGVLGQAGWCYRRSGGLPIVGLMRFDAADVANLESQGRFVDVVLHEMGHVLGLSAALWTELGLLQDRSPEGNPLDTHFTGAAAIAAFDAIGGSSYTGGRKVPVENQFGGGTRNSHWRESVLENELMTGFLNAGINPLSVVTIGALADMGYVVDPSRADPFTKVMSIRDGPAAGSIHLRDDEWKGARYTIDRSGRRTLIPQ